MATVNETNNMNASNPKKDSSERFDIHLLHDSLAKCCADNNTLDMEQYLIAFREMYRFFSLLGSVFGFVASDILSKVDILDSYLKSSGDRYSTIQSMVDHEISNQTTRDPTQPSGCRTLLRLHRSLEFITAFMQDFGSADPQARISAIAQRCYKDTLARHHPWLVQKGAGVAMYTLPAKRQFIERVRGEPCDEEGVRYYGELMGGIAREARKVYDETEKLFEANELLDLP